MEANLMKNRLTSKVIFILVLVLFITTILLTNDAKTQDKKSQQLFQQEEMNKKIAQRLVQALNEKKGSVFDEFVAAKFVQHQNGITESTTGPDVIKGTLEWDRETFKENNYTIEDIISKADKG